MPITLPAGNPTSAAPAAVRLTWRVHLLRRDPRRLPLLIAVVLLAGIGITLWFRAMLPGLVTVALLAGACGEYLLPTTYRLTEAGVHADSLTGRLFLTWQDARRLREGRDGVLVSPLPQASRLDNFRGVLLRYAPDGQPGDRASVYAALAELAPHLLEPSTPQSEPY